MAFFTRFSRLLLTTLTLLPLSLLAQTRAENARAYIDRYKNLAMTEQRRTGMPAAIKLAQGLYETGAGTSELATRANNHFGMKCKRTWTGETYAYTDDAPDECFRKYPSADISYRDQGDYLKGNPRYADCFSLDVKDYKGWATQLRKAGYATNPKYAAMLVKTVEDFDLQQYTLQALEEPGAEIIPDNDRPVANNTGTQIKEDLKEAWQETKQLPSRLKEAVQESFHKSPEGVVETYKGLQGFYAAAGQSLLQDAQRYNVRYAKLLEWNDLPDAPVPYDMFVFLERKPVRATGDDRHVVAAGETLHRIAQKEAIQLASLRALNGLTEGEEPQEGAVLMLQNAAVTKPATYRPQIAATQPDADAASNDAQGSSWVRKEALEATEMAPPESSRPSPDPVAAPTTAPVSANTISTNATAPVGEATPVKPVYDDTPLGRLKAKMDHAVYSKPAPQSPAAPEKTEVPPPTAATPATAPRPEYHIVKKGETVFSIAKQYGVSVTELRKWNRMDFTAMKSGQRLKVKP